MSLRNQIMRGGAFLAARQLFGVVANFFGLLLLAKLIGPTNYGTYVSVTGLLTYTQLVAQWGINTFIIRKVGDVQINYYHQAFTLLLMNGLFLFFCSVLLMPLLQKWMNMIGFSEIAFWMMLSLPISLVYLVPQAKLERSLNFKKLAAAEITGICTFYLVSLSLAALNMGMFAPVFGWWSQQIILLLVYYLSSSYFPKFVWRKTIIKEVIKYGFSFSCSTWVWNLRELVSPLIIGRFLGAEAVAIISLSVRIVRGLSFIKEAMWRISIAGLAKIQNDSRRLIEAISMGMKLQILGQGPLLAIFCLLSTWIIPYFFGNEWSAVIDIYPFVAFSFLTNALFNLHSSAFYVLRKNLSILFYNSVHVAIFILTAYFLVPVMGIKGYGWAEIAAMASYFITHYMVKREIGKLDYRVAIIWWVSFSLVLFVFYIGWIATVGVVAMLLWKQTWKEIGGYINQMKSSTHTQAS
ncbi:oligosaccharide flippase family protein [Paenibacillus cisolokensis]|uniref:oligosaccharide flippase family protein n=1 Tax=Paenibacillus cisolokensis TaxID=1658519 RepID=UPI003D2A6B40